MINQLGGKRMLNRWVKGLLAVGLVAGGIGASSVTAQAKSYAKVVKTSRALIQSILLNLPIKTRCIQQSGVR